VYSVWLWLYFVLTIALTAIVVGGTWVVWKSKEGELTGPVLRKSVLKLFQRKDVDRTESLVPAGRLPNYSVVARQ
jgi:uncharacterized protein YneF (UPF0154 family)